MRSIAVIGSLGVLVVLGVVAVWAWEGRRLERSQDKAILDAARRYEVDPALVKAIVWRESRFNPAARGRAGEIGLMQLQELAAREWADAERITSFEHVQCLDARTNTLAGTFYLSKLLQRYQHTDNPVAYALADYNAGRSNVLKWLSGAGATNSTVFIQQIGFPATRDYVIQVMKRSRRYQL